MKYLFCSLALLAILLVGCSLAAFRISDITEQIDTELSNARISATQNDLPRALLQIEQAYSIWTRESAFFASTLYHTEMNHLTLCFEKLLQYAAFNDQTETLCHLSELQAMLHLLADTELPHFYNFL